MYPKMGFRQLPRTLSLMAGHHFILRGPFIPRISCGRVTFKQPINTRALSTGEMGRDERKVSRTIILPLFMLSPSSLFFELLSIDDLTHFISGNQIFTDEVIKMAMGFKRSEAARIELQETIKDIKQGITCLPICPILLKICFMFVNLFVYEQNKKRYNHLIFSLSIAESLIETI